MKSLSVRISTAPALALILGLSLILLVQAMPAARSDMTLNNRDQDGALEPLVQREEGVSLTEDLFGPLLHVPGGVVPNTVGPGRASLVTLGDAKAGGGSLTAGENIAM
ncbi:hypothetical protein CPB84DRAFT_1791024 [Gymnopilus junonius]|uniref:Uncharacterized protein n=1 Tax=Gymnopilus junonius TaxID=109634 RepID=A0A9P5NB42_GYMJU|nr:hypothetical protein CPB84DRAFT_1793256 [Gymnopilus junonius]KAF8882329.1 hypothetical protein CPB84DRAFT_1791024 [Gymnopilus junonius]